MIVIMKMDSLLLESMQLIMILIPHVLIRNLVTSKYHGIGLNLTVKRDFTFIHRIADLVTLLIQRDGNSGGEMIL